MTLNLSLPIPKKLIKNFNQIYLALGPTRILTLITLISGIIATVLAFRADAIVTYGDAESHLNIAKRVVSSITPGASQLGGIWLPIPHVLMLPFIWNDVLWRTGLAGSIVSGFCYIISTIFIFKTTKLLIKHEGAAWIAALVFAFNPNVLYMQSTPMSELPLIMFFILSTYYFSRFLLSEKDNYSLAIAGFFSFCATLSRYDGWFLVGCQGLIIIAIYALRRDWKQLLGKSIFFGIIGLLGVLLWFGWNWMILGDPLYFTNSEFSAKTQQEAWRAKGQLPAYHNLGQSILYYTVTGASTTGFLIFILGLIGYLWYLANQQSKSRWYIGALFAVPYIFYVFTLFIGQSVIFIPHVTPIDGFDWRLFNVRYGLMMVPVVAISLGYLWSRVSTIGKSTILIIMIIQSALFITGFSKVVALQDGLEGLSQAKRPDAERWMRENYDGGLVLMDDYARSISIIRSQLPMQNTIYIGNKPYWEESLQEPERYVRWIVAQKSDAVWSRILDDPTMSARLYTFFNKVYTSPDTLIFRRIDNKVPNGIGAENQSGKYWSYQCIDTMKFSRDTAGKHLTEGESARSDIRKEVALIADVGANCIAIATPYDDQFYPVLKMWVDEARARGLHVWFRGNFSAWEGWFGREKGMTAEAHIESTQQFILSHPELFEDGDIFTGAPEAENGGPFTGRSTNEFPAYREFLLAQKKITDDSFASIQKKVITNWFSMNGWIAENMYDQPTLDAIGNQVTVDHYTSSVAKMDEFLNYWIKERGTKVALGEFGAPIPDLNGEMTPDEQATYIDQLMRSFYKNREGITGMSYWTLRFGSTGIVFDDLTPKPAYNIIQNYFSPGLNSIQINNPYGEPIDHVEITTLDGLISATTDQKGYALMRLPAGSHTLKIQAKGYLPTSVDIRLEPSGIDTTLVTLRPESQNSIDRIREWWHNLGKNN